MRSSIILTVFIMSAIFPKHSFATNPISIEAMEELNLTQKATQYQKIKSRVSDKFEKVASSTKFQKLMKWNVFIILANLALLIIAFIGPIQILFFAPFIAGIGLSINIFMYKHLKKEKVNLGQKTLLFLSSLFNLILVLLGLFTLIFVIETYLIV